VTCERTEVKMFSWFGKKKIEKQIEKSIDEFKALWDTNIDAIWLIDDKNQFIIAMNGWLCRKCNYGEDIEKLSDAEKTFFICTQLESEVNNGGFSQYFYNSSGDFANETLSSLTDIGANKTADIYSKAFTALGGELPSDRNKREKLLDKLLTDSVSEILSDCDTAFYHYADNLEELNYQYIISNKEHFS
jgi:hypothetical protein